MGSLQPRNKVPILTLAFFESRHHPWAKTTPTGIRGPQAYFFANSSNFRNVSSVPPKIGSPVASLNF